jgi:hypothetical protein
MSKVDTFLTDTRREVLADEYEGDPRNEQTHKTRIRRQSSAVVDELTEVAQSGEISNIDVFDPKTVGDLLFFILRDPKTLRITDSGGGVVKDDEAEQYRNAVLNQLLKQVAKFGEFEVGRDEKGRADE